eukprot:Opistho-2@69516
MLLCMMMACFIVSGTVSHSCVLPWMSVNTNATSPVGASEAGARFAGISLRASWLPFSRPTLPLEWDASSLIFNQLNVNAHTQSPITAKNKTTQKYSVYRNIKTKRSLSFAEKQNAAGCPTERPAGRQVKLQPPRAHAPLSRLNSTFESEPFLLSLRAQCPDTGGAPRTLLYAIYTRGRSTGAKIRSQRVVDTNLRIPGVISTKSVDVYFVNAKTNCL